MIKNARNYLCINAVCCYVKAHRRNRAAVKDSCTLCGSRLTFRLLLHVSRMFSILFMFSSEINISVTTNSKGSGVSGLDLSDATCNLSEGLSESSDALLDKWSAIFSAGVGKKKKHNRRQTGRLWLRIWNSIMTVTHNKYFVSLKFYNYFTTRGSWVCRVWPNNQGGGLWRSQAPARVPPILSFNGRIWKKIQELQWAGRGIDKCG